MKWLEIIELRSVGSNRKLLESQLQNLVDRVNKASKHKTIKIYNHTTVETDFSIHLHHDTKEVDKNGSPLGLQLISTLKEYGLTNHSVWVKKHRK